MMGIATQNDVSKMALDAQVFTSTGDFDKAEHLYRRMIDVIQDYEGPEATSRELYSLCGTLVKQKKYEEAEDSLRNLLVQLTGRCVNGNSGHFLEQEAGAITLLCGALQGQGKSEEAEVLMKNVADQEKQLQARGSVYGLSVL